MSGCPDDQVFGEHARELFSRNSFRQWKRLPEPIEQLNDIVLMSSKKHHQLDSSEWLSKERGQIDRRFARGDYQQIPW
jgi:hypothetical protein